MKCPKCKTVNADGAIECDQCGVIFAHIRGKAGPPKVDLNCPWNDHGIICGQRGGMSDSTTGSGPWYCSAHYWQLKKLPQSKPQAHRMSYRERWYAERGLPYEPPTLVQVHGWQCVGGATMMREMGEDSPEDIGEAAA